MNFSNTKDRRLVDSPLTTNNLKSLEMPYSRDEHNTKAVEKLFTSRLFASCVFSLRELGHSQVASETAQLLHCLTRTLLCYFRLCVTDVWRQLC